MLELKADAGLPHGHDESAIDQFRRHYGNKDIFVDAGPSRARRGAVQRFNLARQAGEGWLEMRQIPQGLVVGMCDYRLHRPDEGRYGQLGSAMGFNLLLSGAFDISLPEANVQTSVRGGELWLRTGFIDGLHYVQPAGRVIRGLSIEVPVRMALAWMDEGPGWLVAAMQELLNGGHAISQRTLSGRLPMSRTSRRLQNLVRTASRLVATPGDTVCGELQIESLALDLLAQILSLELPLPGSPAEPGSRRQAAVDEAVDILRAESVEPPSIAALGRRVGLNECYLKAEFRRRTGLSIGEYVRKLRMEQALELIESGACSILQTALYVGYSNPSHFSAAFKRFHGRLPSCYLPRND